MKRKSFERVARVVTSLHIALYRASGGRIGGSLGGLKILLLTTVGRRTGRARTTPLGYLAEGSDMLIVASNGGNPWFPAWWLNLRESREAQVQVGSRKLAVIARKASREERERFWPRLVDAYQGYATYEQKTTREIPVVILSPGRPDSAESAG
ncbi:MAG TPA: nitroreductase family deazaflavin-dependent oxidoreductase [Actinomycetota bacterium]|nr:nitroreductase family deazaflavin-dependent oxidoreductase [Actinomycetota bacterium]